MMMDRNREARRSANMLSSSNGLARRRHRTNSFRDSPDEDVAVELQESVRLRERVKKDRDPHRDRERSLNRSSKRRRGEKMMIHGSNRDDGGEDTSEESVNDEEDDGGGGGGDNHNHHNNHHHHHKNGPVIGGGGGVRLIPAIPNSAASSAANSTISNHFHNGNSNSNNNNHHHSSNYSNSNTNHVHVRKNIPPSVPKVIPAAAASVASSVLKYGDEMIGVSVPRKARSASTKRSHDWMSSNAAAGGVVIGGGGGGGEHVNRQTSISPASPSLVSPSTALLPPQLSPSSSNVSAKKKIKASGSKQPKPPKSSSKTSSVNPEELEIEIAEVLFGLKTQSQAPPKKVSNDLVEINRSSSDAKSRVSSPLSNSPTTNVQSSTAVLPLNSSSSAGSLTAVAPKRKKPRQVSENPGSFHVRCSPISSMKAETDQTSTAEIISPNLDKNPGSAVENGHKTGCIVNPDGFLPEQKLPQPMKKDLESKLVAEGLGESPDVISGKEVVSSPKKESPAEITEEIGGEDMKVTATVLSSVTKVNSALPDAGTQREEKAQIDLEASPQKMRTSTEREGDVNRVAACEQKAVVYDVDAVTKPLDVKDKEDGNSLNLGKIYVSEADGEDKKVQAVVDESEILKKVENKLKNGDVVKPERDNGVVGKLPQQSQRQNQLPPPKSAKEEPQNERTGQSNTALPLAMSVASWPGGLPPMGYMAPMQGVVTMDGSTISHAPIQPVFSLPRPKRCATHCYIARNIHCLQQFMKINPIWQAAAGSASLYGPKPANISIVPQADLSGSIGARAGNNAPEKAPGLAILPGHGGKDKSSQPSPAADFGQRKQQILLQQNLPHIAANNMMAPTFIFPLNQQQATVAAASARPGFMKQPVNTSGGLASSSTPNASATSVSATAGGAVSFSYPNIADTQYLAILQNNYPFPIPAVGAPPNYRGTHPQSLPLFNGSFYSSQIIHPSQLQHSQQPVSQSLQMQQGHQSSMPGTSSSQKHMQSQQQQQKPAGTSVASGNNGAGNLQNFPAVKNRQLVQSQQALNQQMTASARQVENEVAVEDSASTADSRGSRAPQNIYAQNFSVPMHPQNYALVATVPPALASNSAASSGSNQNEKKHQPQPQQQAVKTAMESLPQNFAMPFDFSRQNAVFQSLPEAKRHNIHNNIQKNIQMMAQHRKNLRISDDGRTGGTDSSTFDDEGKIMAGKSPTAGHSIAFSRSEFADASVSAALANNQVDGLSRSLNLASGGPSWTARSTMPSNMGAAASISNAQSQVQQQQQQQQQQQLQQQQQMMQLRKQYQQLAGTTARSKNNLTSNVSVFSEHMSSTMTSAAGMFPDGLSGVPQSLVQTSHSSNQTQSPQWRSSARTSAAQSSSSFVSSTSSMKNQQQQQQQQGRAPQVQTQISFGSNQKPAAGPQGQPLPSSSQSPSSPMMVGSPSTSSMSKGGGGSPRTASVSAQHPKNSSVPPGQTVSTAQISSLSTQHAKSSPVGGRNVPSILGNPHVSSTSSNVTKYPLELQPHQLQQLRKNLQQAQIFFSSNPSLQSQFQNPPFTTNPNPAGGGGGYYMQRWRPDQQQQQQLGMSSASSSSGLLTSCPVSLPCGGTTDPAKAIAAATAAANNMKGSNLPPSHGILHAAQFASQSTASSYVHNVPAAAIQIKATEQKQQAGNDNLHASWQPEKK